MGGNVYIFIIMSRFFFLLVSFQRREDFNNKP